MLLKTKGVQIAMASIILRFRNKKGYQIIDQRVFQIINQNRALVVNNYKSEENIEKEIELYLGYLNDLKKVCEKPDRVFYMADKGVNKKHKLKNY